MAKKQPAPVYLNLFRIRFPVGAVTSIAHRLSGLLLFAALPLFVWLLGLSLRDAAGFDSAAQFLRQGWVRLLLAVLTWSLFHHLFAGIRFLLIDLGIGVGLPQARGSAWVVNVAALLLAVLCLGYLA
jgi:succinate dehydrogenase / fumarate reductase cytochrome b subunit